MIRDATKILIGQNVLQVIRGRGVFVKQAAETVSPLLPIPNASSIRQLYETRRALEMQIARAAAIRASIREMRQLDRIVTQAEGLVKHSESSNRLLILDSRFHHALAEASHNEVMGHLVDQLEQLLVMARLQSLRIPGRPVVSVQEHRRIVDHIQRRDRDGAAAAMYLHLSEVEAALLRSDAAP